MKTSIEQFRENIARVKNLDAIYTGLIHRTTSALDLSDILRAEIVLGVSALDRFIHDIVRIGMSEALEKKRPATTAFQKFQISMGTLMFSRSNPNEQEWLDWFDNEIRVRHSSLTFQRADKVADAVRLISDIKLWEEVAKELGKDVRSVKSQLDLVIDRRNKIAHEADIIPAPTLPGSRWNIDIDMTKEAIEFIEKLAETMYKIINI